jgi:hypothetical protein
MKTCPGQPGQYHVYELEQRITYSTEIKPMRAKRRMTVTDFEAVRPFLGISTERIDAARAVLVDGQTLQGAANPYGWTRQAVGDSVDVVWKAFEKWQESQRAAASAGTLLPPGWEEVKLIAPSRLIAQFRQMIAEASASETSAATEKKPKKKPNKKPGAGERAGQTST